MSKVKVAISIMDNGELTYYGPVPEDRVAVADEKIVEIKDAKLANWEKTVERWVKLQDELYELFYGED